MKKITIISILFSFISSFTIAAEVNVFNARHYKADAELYGKFTNKTGIKVNLINKLSKHLNDKMPYHNRCKFVNCKHRWSHSTKGHHCHKCFLNHDSNDCMLATKEEAERNQSQPSQGST